MPYSLINQFLASVAVRQTSVTLAANQDLGDAVHLLDRLAVALKLANALLGWYVYNVTRSQAD